MIEAYVITRQEKHVDDRIIVCLNKEDAFKIGEEMAAYWKDKYELPDDMIEYHRGEDSLGVVSWDDYYRVFVDPTMIREAGETAKPEGQR